MQNPPIVRYPTEACRLLQISPPILKGLVDRGDLPPPTYVHRKFQFWLWADFIRAITALDEKYKQNHPLKQ